MKALRRELHRIKHSNPNTVGQAEPACGSDLGAAGPGKKPMLCVSKGPESGDRTRPPLFFYILLVKLKSTGRCYL